MLMAFGQQRTCNEGDRHCRHAGFTLLEVLVALTVLSLSLTLIMSTLSGGLFHQQRAQALTEATLGAQSLLARVGSDLPLRTGVTDGTFSGGLTWRVQMTPYGDAADRAAWPVAAYTVIVQVFRGPASGEPALQMTTMRLGPKL
jgi:general secretion pathway protein I